MKLIHDKKVKYDERVFDGKIEVEGYIAMYKVREKNTEKGHFNLALEIPLALTSAEVISLLKEC